MSENNRPYEKEVQSAILECLEKSSCSNDKQTGRAIGEFVRSSSIALGMLFGFERAAQMLEAMAKDLRIHDAKEKSDENEKH